MENKQPNVDNKTEGYVTWYNGDTKRFKYSSKCNFSFFSSVSRTKIIEVTKMA